MVDRARNVSNVRVPTAVAPVRSHRTHTLVSLCTKGSSAAAAALADSAQPPRRDITIIYKKHQIYSDVGVITMYDNIILSYHPTVQGDPLDHSLFQKL